MSGGRLEEQFLSPLPKLFGIRLRDKHRAGYASKISNHLHRQSPCPQGRFVGQQGQIPFVGEERMHARIGRYDNRIIRIGSAHRFMNGIIEREIDEPVVDQIDRLFTDPQAAAS